MLPYLEYGHINIAKKLLENYNPIKFSQITIDSACLARIISQFNTKYKYICFFCAIDIISFLLDLGWLITL